MRKSRPGYNLVKSLFGKYEEIPEDWEVKKCSKILELRHGYQFREEDFIQENKGIKIIKIGNLLQNGGFDTKNCDLISLERGPNFTQVEIKSGDVLMALTGATLGKTILVHKVDQKLLQNYRVGNFFPKNNTDKGFLYHSLKNTYVQKQIWFLVNSNAQPNIGKEDFDKIKMICPTLPEQQKIASILSNVDNLIESYNKAIEKTKKLKTGLMQQLLTKGIGHKKFKNSELGKIPEDWEVVSLSSLAKIERGKFTHRPRNDPKFYGGNYPFIQTGDVESSNGRITKYTQTLNEKGFLVSKLFPEMTIVITIAANIGSTAITTFPVCFPDSLIGITPNNMKTEFLEYYLRTKKEYLNNIATNSAQKNINLETLKPLKIIKPKVEEQQKIASILNTVDSKISELESKKKHIEFIKKGLMQKLLTGQIRVKV